MTPRELTEALAELDRRGLELARAQEGLREFARERDAFRRELEAERERRQGVEKQRDEAQRLAGRLVAANCGCGDCRVAKSYEVEP